MAMGILEKKQAAVVEPEQPASRVKMARLTTNGRRLQEEYRQLLGAIEKRWQARFQEKQSRTYGPR